MSGVVLRCPSCGTTRAAPGECEACHEAQVRYYCTNHTPGRWLDSRSCPQCGSQFGVPDRPPAVPRPRVARVLPPPLRRSTPPLRSCRRRDGRATRPGRQGDPGVAAPSPATRARRAPEGTPFVTPLREGCRSYSGRLPVFAERERFPIRHRSGLLLPGA